MVAGLACLFLVVRSRYEKEARKVEATEKTKQAEAEARVSAAALLTKVLATSLGQQVPKSLSEAISKTSGDLTNLETGLKTTTVDTVLVLMTGKTP